MVEGWPMPIWVVFLLVLALFLIPFAWLAGRAYFRHHGTRAVICPESELPATVRVDALHAAASTAIGELDVRLSSCSRWPEAKDCGQRCLAQIEAAPPECVLQTTLVDWYQRTDCAICGREIGKVHWVEYKPALLTPERKTIEWEDVTPENLAEVLKTHQRVCWRCHAVNAWRDRFPGFDADEPSSQTS